MISAATCALACFSSSNHDRVSHKVLLYVINVIHHMTVISHICQPEAKLQINQKTCLMSGTLTVPSVSNVLQPDNAAATHSLSH